jgi:hypothetical protein
MKDKLWFFAGRDIGDRVTSFETSITPHPVRSAQTETRFGGKRPGRSLTPPDGSY